MPSPLQHALLELLEVAGPQTVRNILALRPGLSYLSAYTTLVRMEAKALVASRQEQHDDTRGHHRQRRLFYLAPDGRGVLRAIRRDRKRFVVRKRKG